jgi:hypothetical protein
MFCNTYKRNKGLSGIQVVDAEIKHKEKRDISSFYILLFRIGHRAYNFL